MPLGGLRSDLIHRPGTPLRKGWSNNAETEITHVESAR
jgi:hypothetical protein